MQYKPKPDEPFEENFALREISLVKCDLGAQAGSVVSKRSHDNSQQVLMLAHVAVVGRIDFGVSIDVAIGDGRAMWLGCRRRARAAAVCFGAQTCRSSESIVEWHRTGRCCRIVSSFGESIVCAVCPVFYTHTTNNNNNNNNASARPA
jgi:hypothetical protein